MPERFRYLTKEAPDPVILLIMVIFGLRAAVGFLLYAWRAVMLELSNWRNAAFAVVGFVGYFVRAFYSGIVAMAYAAVKQLTVIICATMLHQGALDKDPGDGFVSSSSYLSSFTIGRSGGGTEKRLPLSSGSISLPSGWVTGI
ncbi:hypothetical protein GQ457_18G014550 [Hibiscus cannabinus]